MKKKTFVQILLGLLAVVPLSAGVIIDPVAVLLNTGGDSGSSFGIINTINQSGLSAGYTSGVTNFDTYLATGPSHTYVAAGFEWFATLGVDSSTIIYDLGSAYNIDRLAIWNEESSGIATMSVLACADSACATTSSMGSTSSLTNWAPNSGDSSVVTSYTADVVSLTTRNTRYIELMVTGPQAGSDYNAVSMGEIAFDSVTSAVPEPGSLGLVSAGLGGLLLLLRKRNSN